MFSCFVDLSFVSDALVGAVLIVDTSSTTGPTRLSMGLRLLQFYQSRE